MNLFEPNHSAEPNFNEGNDSDPTLHFAAPSPAGAPMTETVQPPPQAAPLFNTQQAAPITQEIKQENNYSIEHVIRILRTSPMGDQQQAISIILSTLESAGINTQSLLTDATQKEEQAQTAIQKFEKEIEFLKMQIQERQQQMDTFTDLMNEFRLIKNKIIEQKS